MEGEKASGGHNAAAWFNPVQVDMQWIRRVQKEERNIMDAIEGKPRNKLDDVY